MPLSHRVMCLCCHAETPAPSLRVVHVGEADWTCRLHLPVDALVEAAASRLILDLSAVGRMCTAAFAELVILHQRLAARGCELRLLGLRDQPRHLCRVLKLAALLGVDSHEPAQAPKDDSAGEPLAGLRPARAGASPQRGVFDSPHVRAAWPSSRPGDGNLARRGRRHSRYVPR